MKSNLATFQSFQVEVQIFFPSNEEAAMHHGKYTTSLSSVDTSSSKSLLNRYSLSVPLEPNCRTSREAAILHMPIYADRENKLILPSHLPPNSREVDLPIIFHGESKRKKQSLLALAACVRLHKLGLLNDRLLPLDTSDMKEWLLEKALLKLPSIKRQRQINYTPNTVYVYSICQSGARFSEEENRLRDRGPGELQLALISLSALPQNLPTYSFRHKELGAIECQISYCGKISLSTNEWKELTDFHCIIFNARWRRKKARFCFDERLLLNHNQAVIPYIIGCLNSGGGIDWALIRTTIAEFARSKEAREKAADGSSMLGPRVWSPSYSPGVSYIVYGCSGKRCKDRFPGEEYTSFSDYYAKKYDIETNPEGNMFLAKRVWEKPKSLGSTQRLDEDIRATPTVELPQELCHESPLADPLIVLHSVMLPQL